MNKITKFITRYKNAQRLGLSYFRTSSFHLPEKIDFNGNSINLDYPDEKGIFIDFLSIFLDDDYGLTKFRKNKISKIIDIGANVGFFSLASKFFFPNSEIHAYEPNLDLKRYLDYNFSQLNIELHTQAVGVKSGSVKLDLIGESNQTRVKESSSGTTEIVSLDSVLKKVEGKIDLLKMDCEGSEWDILENPESLRQVDNVTLEYHLWANQQDHEYAKDLVMSHGFKIFKHLPSLDFGIICAKKLV
jgi:FkbM family methyltransferase